VINYKKKFIFIHIPKTAGSSLESSLLDADSCLTKGLWSKKGFESPLNHLTLTQLADHEELTVSELRKFFKFAFVRNPWDKVISECFCPHIQSIFTNCKSIKDKIKVVCSWSRGNGYGGHCAKQISFLRHPDIELDFIGKFENLSADFSAILQRLDLAPRLLSHLNRSSREPDYRHYFDSETESLVRKCYREDIATFNYSY